MLDKINEAADFLRKRMPNDPKVAIVLGSGLGDLFKDLTVYEEIPYAQIPHFPQSTVVGHKGSWVFGCLNGVDVIVQNGRFHYYEGYDVQSITLPIRVFKALGVKTVFLSNAAGGINPSFQVGDIMLIRDHINFSHTNPLIGKNYDELGPRFPDMSEAYSIRLRKLAHQISNRLNIHLQEGVYVGLTGPSFETPAEYRMFDILGGDAVGMSTVLEVITARHANLEVCAMSVISNVSVLGNPTKATHEEVLQAANEAGQHIASIIRELLPQL